VAGTVNGFYSISQPNAVAFHRADNPTVGSPLQINVNQLDVIWSQPFAVGFGLAALAVPGPATPNTGTVICEGAPASRVQVGVRARVSDNNEANPLPLRLRSTPGGEFVQSIPAGTEFSIVGGPQCASQYLWWQIRLADGTVGWSAEGDLSQYFIEPVPQN
jgi:hypothetical protein